MRLDWTRRLAAPAFGAALALALTACVAALEPTPTPTPTATATSQPSPTNTATALPTPTATEEPSPTATLEAAPTAAPTLEPTTTVMPTPLPTPDGAARSLRVPILMYHHIAVAPGGADAVRRDLSVSPQRFEDQLRYLKEQGYESISLYDLSRHLQLGEPLPAKPVMFTFDDGYDDNFTNAFPLLVKYGFTGTFFLITEPIDSGRDGYVTWPQVAVMDRLGMDMEPHTYTHPDLSGQPLDYVIWQVMGSKEAIEERTGKTCRFFSYPSGQYDEQVVSVLRSAYFWGAVTVTAGDLQDSQHMFELPRIRVRGSFTLENFITYLNLDW